MVQVSFLLGEIFALILGAMIVIGGNCCSALDVQVVNGQVVVAGVFGVGASSLEWCCFVVLLTWCRLLGELLV